MKAKKVKWTDKPMTWGGYFKFAGISAVISVLLTIAGLIPWYRSIRSWQD